MSNLEPISSDDEFFDNNFFESIPDDSDPSVGDDDDFYSNNTSSSPLTLEPIIRHPKGRMPSTARFKGPLQTST
ncbi:hypothetical protein RCL_jg8575.t1 [Rhizophagus clarus]|uniref:Uncharacterized protein n=1 Tax=Rhizophagus clarus TaxID=94130 RepID=A0A8H3M4F5_9GLOM|nr:hypothetical protein RCL_jg8575.t1 [Rhizophagus clarus]